MSKLNQFFELVGVRPNSDFRLKGFGSGLDLKYLYSFRGNGMLEKSTGTSFPEYIPRILNGELKIVQEPFKPSLGTSYWYIVPKDGELNCTSYYPSNTCDVGSCLSGNCFPTENISDEQYQEIKSKFESVGVDVSGWRR